MNIDEEIDRMRIALQRMERGEKRKSAVGRFSVGKKLRVAPITKRMRSTGVTPRTAKKVDTRTSRSRQMQPRKLTFGSGTNSRSSSVARPGQGRMDPVLSAILSGNNKPYEESLIRIKANSRKVRHKNARKVLNKMPAGGKPYAKRRMTSRKPKGAYRGAVMPRWAKGETKHILMNDQCRYTNAVTTGVNPSALQAQTGSGLVEQAGETLLDIGELAAWSLNPMKQGNGITERNGRSVDGTYCRIQGHIRNSGATGVKAYVRMLVLMVKGGHMDATAADRGAPFNKSSLFKKIDGSIKAFDDSNTGHAGEARVRSLQLPINKSEYTVLADQKMQLASSVESFGSSDRLFDLKIPLKQKTSWHESTKCDSFEKNQLVFVIYSADPNCNSNTQDADLADQLHLEFESKYSYKDF